MNQTTDTIDLKDNQTKGRRIDLYKFILYLVRGGKFQYILIENSYKYNLDCYNTFFYNFFIPYPWRISSIIQFLLDYLEPTLIDHLSHYLSAYPIRHPFRLSVSFGSQGSTIQGSSLHKYGQKVSCRAFNVVATTFPQIFPSFHSSSMFTMHVPLSGISQKVTLSNRIYV